MLEKTKMNTNNEEGIAGALHWALKIRCWIFYIFFFKRL